MELFEGKERRSGSKDNLIREMSLCLTHFFDRFFRLSLFAMGR
jgi:hypothetical protein